MMRALSCRHHPARTPHRKRAKAYRTIKVNQTLTTPRYSRFGHLGARVLAYGRP
jgi:hypothetical protein